MVAWLTCTLLSRHTAALSFMALAAASVLFLWANGGVQPALRTLVISLSVAMRLGHSGRTLQTLGSQFGVFYPYHPQLDFNVFGERGQSLLPKVRLLVLDTFLEHSIADPKWLALRLLFRHWLMFVASLSATMLSMIGRIFKPGKCVTEWRMMPGYFFAAGCAILLPLLFVTPSADWRYIMPASVCWLIGILGAGALVVEVRGLKN